MRNPQKHGMLSAECDVFMSKVKIYLDMCCFNRPYDDQTQQRIQFEAAAKLTIQSLIVDGQINSIRNYPLT